jgi:hypothetical protein
MTFNVIFRKNWWQMLPYTMNFREHVTNKVSVLINDFLRDNMDFKKQIAWGKIGK